MHTAFVLEPIYIWRNAIGPYYEEPVEVGVGP